MLWHISHTVLGAVDVSELAAARIVLPMVLLAALWTWETCWPLLAYRTGRLRHAGRNLSIAMGNAVVLAVSVAALTALVAGWTQDRGWGLLNFWELPPAVQLALGVVLLDAYMYFWHRANHVLPLLWRFHRMHHSDPRMDVTTATRFHLGEHLAGGVLRLGLIPLLGLSLWQVLIYELLVTAVTQFHHANISLGRLDRWLRLVIVTPDMHKVHHSRWQPETDSNFATVFSVWDRLLGTFRRGNPNAIQFGLSQFDDEQWQTIGGMLRTPLAEDPQRNNSARAGNRRDLRPSASQQSLAVREREGGRP